MRGTLQVEGRALSSRWRTAVSSLAAVLALNLRARAADVDGHEVGVGRDGAQAQRVQFTVKEGLGLLVGGDATLHVLVVVQGSNSRHRK